MPLNSLFLSRFCCGRVNDAKMFFEKVLNKKVVEFALFYLFYRLLKPNKTKFSTKKGMIRLLSLNPSVPTSKINIKTHDLTKSEY